MWQFVVINNYHGDPSSWEVRVETDSVVCRYGELADIAPDCPPSACYADGNSIWTGTRRIWDEEEEHEILDEADYEAPDYGYNPTPMPYMPIPIGG